MLSFFCRAYYTEISSAPPTRWKILLIYVFTFLPEKGTSSQVIYNHMHSDVMEKKNYEELCKRLAWGLKYLDDIFLSF